VSFCSGAHGQAVGKKENAGEDNAPQLRTQLTAVCTPPPNVNKKIDDPNVRIIVYFCGAVNV
jgi:hypothetical protein